MRLSRTSNLLVVAVLALGRGASAQDAAAPPRDADAVARLVAEAAAKGAAGDWKTAKLKIASARAVGGADADIPEPLREGLARYETSLAPAAEAERLKIPLT